MAALGKALALLGIVVCLVIIFTTTRGPWWLAYLVVVLLGVRIAIEMME